MKSTPVIPTIDPASLRLPLPLHGDHSCRLPSDIIKVAAELKPDIFYSLPIPDVIGLDVYPARDCLRQKKSLYGLSRPSSLHCISVQPGYDDCSRDAYAGPADHFSPSCFF